jgi:NAD(P)-dependent dehydrogenase (short-subunit alcohol dehydrogenase family)
MSTKQTISLVTGASRGIGFEVCRQLAKKGHIVVLGVRSVDAGNKACDAILQTVPETNKKSLHVVQLDVTDSKIVKAAADEIGRSFDNKLDCLINNAGQAITDDATNLNVDDARKIFETNFFGVITVTNAMLPLLRNSDAGRIVNVSSILGSIAEHADPNSSFIRQCKTTAYSASKAALNMYTVDLSNALDAEAKSSGKKRIAANIVHPGWIETDLGSLLGKPPSDLAYGAKQIVDAVGGSKGVPFTGGFFHNKLQLRW